MIKIFVNDPKNQDLRRADRSLQFLIRQQTREVQEFVERRFPEIVVENLKRFFIAAANNVMGRDAPPATLSSGGRGAITWPPLSKSWAATKGTQGRFFVHTGGLQADVRDLPAEEIFSRVLGGAELKDLVRAKPQKSGGVVVSLSLRPLLGIRFLKKGVLDPYEYSRNRNFPVSVATILRNPRGKRRPFLDAYFVDYLERTVRNRSLQQIRQELRSPPWNLSLRASTRVVAGAAPAIRPFEKAFSGGRP